MIEEGWGEGHKFPVITALSSLDATQFPALAIQRIQEMLMPGGHFVHIQDVRPGLGVNFRELNHMGHKAPFRAYGTANGDPFVFIAGLGAYSVGELFRRNIGRAVHEAAGMDLLFNRWVTATRDIEGPISRIYYLNALIQSAIHETLDMPAFEEASAVVTVARKR